VANIGQLAAKEHFEVRVSLIAICLEPVRMLWPF